MSIAAKRQRVDSLADSESQGHSSSIGPRAVLYLRTKNSGVDLKHGECVIFGDEPALPQPCQSDDKDLHLPEELREPPRPVHELKIRASNYMPGDTSALGARHGIIWADASGKCYMRALPNDEGMCKNGIKIKELNEWKDAVKRRETVFQDYLIPKYATKFCVDRKKTDLHVVIDWVANPCGCELLCIGCSPSISPLPEVGSEINAVAHACQWGPNLGARRPSSRHQSWCRPVLICSPLCSRAPAAHVLPALLTCSLCSPSVCAQSRCAGVAPKRPSRLSSRTVRPRASSSPVTLTTHVMASASPSPGVASHPCRRMRWPRCLGSTRRARVASCIW